MSFLWTSREFVDAISGRPLGEMPEGVIGISIDSRTIQPGEAFFAIKGENFDGHRFCTAAIAAGARLLVVSEAKLPSLGRLTVPMVVVDDVLAALERLALASRARTKAQIIAVTGSVGKTTTKEALRHMLARSGTVHASEKSFNNHWGVPLTMARLPRDADFGVFEIGMNHPGEIRSLVKFVKPHVALITIIAPAHLGNFVSIEEIAHAKAEIFEGLVPGGYAVLNRDDPLFRLLETLAHTAGVDHFHTYGEHARATSRLAEVFAEGNGSFIKVRIAGKGYSGHLSLPGRHIAQNITAALAACYLAGADLQGAMAALTTLPAAPGRGERHNLKHPKGGRFLLVDESYNANPTSMRAAIRSLAETSIGTRGRRIAVLGDMLELGEHSQQLHAELVEPILEAGIDKVFLGGPQMEALAEKLPSGYPAVHRETADELKRAVIEAVRPGDAVMVKASNGIGFSRIVTALKETFPAEGSKEQAAKAAAGE